MKRTAFIIGILLAAGCLAGSLTGCANDGAGNRTGRDGRGIRACRGNRAMTEHVILIGLDGMGSAYFEPEELPAIKSLMEEGCWTTAKRSAFPTSSAINWATMFMGAGTELHGYTQWYSRTPELPSRVVNDHGIFPTINSILREQRPDAEIGAIYEWETIKYLVDSLALNYFEQAADWEQNPSHLADLAAKYITEKKPVLFTIVFNQPDHVGHADGWGTDEYHQVVRQYDSEVAKILQAIRDAGIWETSTVIVTADHGGIDKGHGKITPAEYETPFVIAGKGIRQGGEFSESMMQYDIASTIAALLGLEQPQVWTGRPMSQCFER